MSKALLLLLLPVFSQAQKWETKPCPIDTAEGKIFIAKEGYNAVIDGYYIAPCGGLRMGPYMDEKGPVDVPVFIPAYTMGYYYHTGDKKKTMHLYRQKNSGYFTDKDFKRLPIDAIYGMMVEQKKPEPKPIEKPL